MYYVIYHMSVIRKQIIDVIYLIHILDVRCQMLLQTCLCMSLNLKLSLSLIHGRPHLNAKISMKQLLSKVKYLINQKEKWEGNKIKCKKYFQTIQPYNTKNVYKLSKVSIHNHSSIQINGVWALLCKRNVNFKGLLLSVVSMTQ